MKVTAIFDIGKTNKKFFLFDSKGKEVYKRYTQFDEIEDEDGHPCEDLRQIEVWLKSILFEIRDTDQFEVEAINFSTYGASFVHLDQFGKPLTPLYNYLKPYPEYLLKQFYSRYGTATDIARQTASPQMGMLNSGMQIYWLKHTYPQLFEEVRWSLHFPQYISYLFTGVPISEYTSIGCHTGLWDYVENDYHRWVYEEGINDVLPPVVDANTSINTIYFDRKVKIGLGIHDSSAALVPYLKAAKGEFILLSTGTWSIAINPFNSTPLTHDELAMDCLNYMRTDGKSVKAARLFLGQEHKSQVQKLNEYFEVEQNAHHHVTFDAVVYRRLLAEFQFMYHFDYLDRGGEQPFKTDYSKFDNYHEAYHQLILELIQLQERSLKLIISNDGINKLYVDGGFADNDLFVQMLVQTFPKTKVRTSKSPLGSALGAALVVSDRSVGSKFFKKHYQMIKHSPILSE